MVQAQGQMQTAHWFFGGNAGVDFSSGAPQIEPNGQVVALEGTASISDEDGNLLFYTNGRYVYTHEHTVMENGFGLRGDNSSTSSAVIVPKPDDCNIYYVFTIDVRDEEVPFFRPKRGMEYNIVDMSLNNGLGAVTQKNIEIPINGIQQGYERLAAITNADKTGYWIVTHFEGNFYSFSVTPDGVNLTPVVSPSPQIFGGSTYIGYLKPSHNGARLAMAGESENYWHNNGYLAVYDFDNLTGSVSNEILIYAPNSTNPACIHYYGIEFSPNNQLLYCSKMQRLYPGNDSDITMRHETIQYNLTQSPIAGSEYVLGETHVYGALQMGLDGKIYQNQGMDEDAYLAVITNPDVAYNPVTGAAPGFDNQGFYLGYFESGAGLGLPTFLNSYFRIAITVNSLSIHQEQSYCTGTPLDFDFCSQGGDIDSINWDFGDGTTATDFYPSHYYNEPGAYTIILTLIVEGEEYIRHFDITITGPPDVVDATLTVCKNEGEEHTFNLQDSTTGLNPQNGNYQFAFFQTLEDAEDNQNVLALQYSITQNSTVWVRVTDENGCYVIRTVSLVYDVPTVTVAAPDYDVCADTPVQLTANTNSADNIINWYNSETATAPVFTGNPFTTPNIGTDTTYWAEAVNTAGCTSVREPVTIEVLLPEQPVFNIQQQYCINGYAPALPSISANGFTGSWSPAAINTSATGQQTYVFTVQTADCSNGVQYTLQIEVIGLIVPEFALQQEYFFGGQPGTFPNTSLNGITGYWATTADGYVTYHTFYADEGQCAAGTFVVRVIDYPRYFSPNGDGINDYWSLININNYTAITIRQTYIFDRYGKLLHSLSGNERWDGTFKGKNLPSTDYWFKVNYLENISGGQPVEKTFSSHFSLIR
ncbi:hypothetical protein AM493_05675 [Flavobacterium akiainvivens]|uniref:PKD domain-containing protein n=2 Tax=Flavobacterium akiainvivens TaxID=1202724 RepID=A0A0M8MHA0_9FLAO|nr:hypothetical protein AM493_05675 [Flavobacterium akiainvivens]